MALINWREELSVNIAEIDLQHQKLIAIINELHDAMRDGRTNDILHQLIDELANYSETHFALEEKYFDELNYSSTALHKAEHQEFRKKISEFRSGFNSGKLFVSMEIIYFLKEWLVNHILVSDKHYSSFFIEKGLK
jgi:hemerythrin